MQRWNPAVPLSKRETFLVKRLGKVRTLFAFLRLHRHEVFDDAFQEALESMYRQTGAGDEPLPPAMMCMVVLLQGYVGASDQEAVELTVVDLRWQMVLDCLGAEEPLFAQGTLQAFRERLIAHDMDRVLMERTVTMVRATAATKKQGDALAKDVRVAMDSRPLTGAGRVEDTINLLGHAASAIVRIVSKLLHWSAEKVCNRAGCTLLLAPSIKGALDIDWSDPRQKATAIEIVERQVSALQRWVELSLDEETRGYVQDYLDTVGKVKEQDLEWTREGRVAIRQGVAPDRQISVEDTQMRHGRKSKSKRFDGYKEHIARDLDLPLILSCAVTPANRPEEEGARPLADDIARQGLILREMHIDRAYVNSEVTAEVRTRGGDVFAKPWALRSHRPGLYSKAEFYIHLPTRTITCPAGQVEPFEPGETVHFDPEACGACPQRASCTQAASGRGRTVSIANDEAVQKKFRVLQSTPSGRATLRRRVPVEHSLARIAARKGPVARYRGVRKNLFDLRRAAAIHNLEALWMMGRVAA